MRRRVFSFIFFTLLTSIVQAEDWNFHFQSTTVTQGHGNYNSPYAVTLSLMGDSETRTSQTATAFLGRRLWTGGQVFINPEMAAGSGLSGTHGVAGFPNGEIYRVDSADAKFSISRAYLQQVFELGGEKEKIDDDKNQFAESIDKSRVTVVFGKFSLNDFFDNNTYSHDPRTQFLNWALMDNGAWDYAADTRGYTWGVYFEFNQSNWAIRAASVLEPIEANQLELETNISRSHGDNIEFESRFKIKEHPGKIRILYYQNHAHMGNYRLSLASGTLPPDITTTRDDRVKYGFGINLEQEVTSALGLFSRWGWSDGATETWAFTEIDSTFSFGLNIKGSLWHRESDNIGMAYIANGLSADHIGYLNAGGVGFLIGDGKLNYAREQILEIYYLYKPFTFLGLSADYQFVTNPAYNQDRGPVSIFAARAHIEF